MKINVAENYPKASLTRVWIHTPFDETVNGFSPPHCDNTHHLSKAAHPKTILFNVNSIMERLK